MASPWNTIRALTNIANLSTPLGLLIAMLGHCSFRLGPRGIVFAENYRLGFPIASAFTVGNVVLIPHATVEEITERNPRLIEHEDAHVTQYAMCLGVIFLPLYLIANLISWLRTGTIWRENVFEKAAGLASGGYTDD